MKKTIQKKLLAFLKKDLGNGIRPLKPDYTGGPIGIRTDIQLVEHYVGPKKGEWTSGFMCQSEPGNSLKTYIRSLIFEFDPTLKPKIVQINDKSRRAFSHDYLIVFTPESASGLDKYGDVLNGTAVKDGTVYKFRDANSAKRIDVIQGILKKSVSNKLTFINYHQTGSVQINCKDKQLLTRVRKALWAIGFHTKTSDNYVTISQ